MMKYLYVLLTIVLTVFGQIVIKWQMSTAGAMPEVGIEKLFFLLRQLLNPWMIAACLAAVLAALSWMAAMTKLPLSVAYPYVSCSFVLILLCSHFFLHESLTVYKLAGVGLIVLGIAVSNLE